MWVNLLILFLTGMVCSSRHAVSSHVARGFAGLNCSDELGSFCWSCRHSKKCCICRPLHGPDLDFLKDSFLVLSSGLHNFSGLRFPVPSSLKVSVWRSLLSGFSDTLLVEMLEFGFPVGAVSLQVSTAGCRSLNHKGAREFPDSILKFLHHQTSLNRVLGPFKVNPFPRSFVSPLNTVSKKDSSDRRIILDLSCPANCSLNSFIPKDSYLGFASVLRYPSVDNLSDLIRKKGRGCFLFKRDLKSAFRQLPVDSGDVGLLGYKWKAHFFFDRVLPMGLRSACQACQRVTSAVRFIFNELGYDLVNYVDDLAGCESSAADVAFEALAELLSRLGLEEASEKACPPSTKRVF